MIVYKDKSGNVSAVQRRGSQPVRVVGFNKRQTGFSNLFSPITEPLEPKSSSCAGFREGSQDAKAWVPKDYGYERLCLKCASNSDDGLHLGPDGPHTLCIRCHRRYSCRELPLYKDVCGSITVSVTSHRVDHVGFHLEGMQRDLAQPITEPWLGKARVSATVLETKKLRSRVVERVSRLEHTAFKFRKVHRHRNQAISIAASAAMMAAQRASPAVSGGVRVKGEDEAGLHSQHDSRAGRDLPRVNRVIRLANCAHGHKGEITGGSGSDTALQRGHQLAATRHGSSTQHRNLETRGPLRSGMAVKASCRTAGMVIVRRFAFDPKLRPETFIQHVRDIFSLTGDFFIRYKDEAGDEITVSTGAEITELFVVALETSVSPIRIEITPLYDDPTLLIHSVVRK